MALKSLDRIYIFMSEINDDLKRLSAMIALIITREVTFHVNDFKEA